MSEQVKIFTEESTGIKVPDTPQLMTKNEVSFLIKMVIDELLELYSTVEGSELAKYSMINMIVTAKNLEKEEGDEISLIANQNDACIDAYYYMLNATVKKGVNISKIFDIVHDANMNKKDTKTGKFIKNNEGKILKPEGWCPPDINSEILRQKKDGSWN